MSPRDVQLARLDCLLQRMCDGRLTEAERVELVDQLQGSEEARLRYIEFVNLSISLADWSLSGLADRQQRTHECGQVRLSRYPELHGVVRATSTSETIVSAATDERSSLRTGLAVFMALAAALLVTITVVMQMQGSHQVPSQVSNQALPSMDIEVTPVSQELFVARVLEVTPDADWDVEAMPREFLMRLRPGEQVHLLNGMAMIEFYSGTRIILHGPARFEPTGLAAAHLHQGRLSGRVENGDFLLVTPSAEVIDLGTEFGVSVGDGDETDVLVFNGEVEVRSDATDPRTQSETVNLTEGMTVRVSKGGHLSGQSYMRTDRFSRRFAELLPPSEDGTELSMVDIFCGGSGRGQRLAAGIDPLTGEWDRLGWQKPGSPGTRRGDVAFHPSPWHPMIDGAFIPDTQGRPTQVDSFGREVFLSDDHGTYTWGPVWARRFSHDLTMMPQTEENDFWGADTFPVITTRLSDSRYGGIGIHASAGISFDLNGIRDQHSAEIASFKAVLTNLDNSEQHNPEYARENTRSAHFWVIIDGEIRYEQLYFARNVEGTAFEVLIRPEDRVLTLVTADAGDSNKYDHIVLIDPVLNVHSEFRVLRQAIAESVRRGETY